MKRLSFKDKQFFKGMAVCNNFTKDQALQIISNNRLHDLQKEGYIQRISYQDKHMSTTKSQHAYRLTDKGRDLCKDTLHCRHLGKGKHEVRHSVACADAYLKLTPEQRMNSLNEGEQRDYCFNKAYQLLSEGRIDEGQELIDQIRESSFVDLCVVTTTETTTEIICIEVITSSYSADQVEAHAECAHEVLHCTTYETININ